MLINENWDYNNVAALRYFVCILQEISLRQARISCDWSSVSTFHIHQLPIGCIPSTRLALIGEWENYRYVGGVSEVLNNCFLMLTSSAPVIHCYSWLATPEPRPEPMNRWTLANIVGMIQVKGHLSILLLRYYRPRLFFYACFSRAWKFLRLFSLWCRPDICVYNGVGLGPFYSSSQPPELCKTDFPPESRLPIWRRPNISVTRLTAVPPLVYAWFYFISPLRWLED